MFSKLVHKVCENSECAKQRVPQEPGLYLCESCQGELTPVHIRDKRAIAATVLVATLIVGMGSSLAWHFIIDRLSLWEAVRVAAGIDKLDLLKTNGRSIGGRMVTADGTVWYEAAEFETAPFIRRKEGSALIFRHRHHYRNGETFQWELKTNLHHLYFLTETPGKARLLNKGAGDGQEEVHVNAPIDGTRRFRMDDHPGIERFVAIYADQPLVELERLEPKESMNAGDFRDFVRNLETKPDVVVYHIELPHDRT